MQRKLAGRRACVLGATKGRMEHQFQWSSMLQPKSTLVEKRKKTLKTSSPRQLRKPTETKSGTTMGEKKRWS